MQGHEWESLSHVRWECKYHVVIIPKYRRKILYGKLRRKVGAILRDLCDSYCNRLCSPMARHAD